MLSAELDNACRRIGTADLAIGIPTYNNAQTIGAVLEAVRLGLAKHFPDARAVLVTSDAGSSDDTGARVAAAEWPGERVMTAHEAPPGERVAVPYHGIPGRAAAQRRLLEIARRLEVRACALLAADAAGIAADWVERLLRPVLDEGCDYVAPLPQRHRYDGTLTYGLVYPLMSALYGKRIRHPLGGQVTLSGRLVAHLVAHLPDGDVARQGLDLWVTAVAAAGDFKLCETGLGSGRTTAAGHPPDLATALAQVVGSAFALVDATAEVWAEIRGSQAIPIIGAAPPVGVEPVEVNVARMGRAFRLGLKDLLPLWEQVLAPETLGEVLALESVGDEAPSFPDDLWARVVFDFALGYHFRVVYREHLLRSLVPLYLGRTAAFVAETVARSAGATEAWLEGACRAFEDRKPYFVARWQ